MPDNPIIDVAIGLVFFYVLLSLVVSSAQEWIASLWGMRSKNLYEGIRRFIGQEYAQKVYEHPLIRNLSKEGKKPSYIDSHTLSTVLLTLVAKDKKQKAFLECGAEEVREIISQIDSNHSLYGILDVLLGRDDEDAEKTRDRLADWFDEGMTRIAGWYKRKVKVVICVLAAVVTVGLNASTIHIAEKLWQDDALRAYIAVQAQDFSAQDEATRSQVEPLKTLESFPIWWKGLPESAVEWIKTVFGWFITIAAVSLGAPFWFDLLGKVANMRGSGGRSRATANGQREK